MLKILDIFAEPESGGDNIKPTFRSGFKYNFTRGFRQSFQIKLVVEILTWQVNEAYTTTVYPLLHLNWNCHTPQRFRGYLSIFGLVDNCHKKIINLLVYNAGKRVVMFTI